MTEARRWPARGRAAAARWSARLDAPVDIAWLAAFRVLFGATMCVSMLRFIGYGWIDTFFVTPSFHFKYWGFGWVQALPGPWMHAVFWALAGLALLVAVGLWFRIAALLFVLGFTYLQLIDVTTYLNHYYLASLLALLLALSPADRAGSIRVLRDRAEARRQVPAFWLYLLRFQVGVVYTFAGLAKAHGDWLLHGQPLRIWLNSHTDLAVLGWFFSQEGSALLMSWAGFLFDTSIPWLLLWPRVRPYAYGVVIVFHAVTRMLFPIGMFPVIMVLSALVFFPPGWPRRWLPWGRWAPRALAVHVAAAPIPNRWRTAGLALAAVYCVVQLLLPLRFVVYGGNVRWHEQGMRFSWRVMVREKNGSVTFKVRQKATGRMWHVSPRAYLTGLQEREMSGQPDLILQLAHHIADDFARKGRGPVEVHVDALVSLNGRRMAPLIDPTVDLAAIDDGLGKARWVLPAPDDPPPRLRPI